MKRILLLLLLLQLAGQAQIRADEGMWLLSLLEKLNMEEMHELGLELTADDIYSLNKASLKDAIGALDFGSCTAGLVSADGLLLTNHHCAYDEIQFHSSMEKNYLRDGFWAMSRGEELPNEGKTVTFLVRMEEVTDQIVPELSENMDHYARDAKIRSLSSKIVSEVIGGTAYEGRVQSLYNNNRYFLFVTETYRDVRLVGAPPESIGKFGGETDNWEWPRHTGDFSLFRVYTGPDGKPADYHPDNIPFKSKYYLPISLAGYEKGGFAMVLGYPGTTHRYMTSWEVEELLEITNPNRIKIRGIKLALQKEDMLTDSIVRLQYAAKYTSSSNYYKYSIGQSKQLELLDVVGKKRAKEEAFSRWISGNPAREEIYGEALETIRGVVDRRRDLKNAEQYLKETLGTSSSMESVYFARHLEGLERALRQSEERPEFLEAEIERLREEAESFYRDYNALTDRKVMTALIKLLLEDLDEEYLPSNIAEVKGKYKGDVQKYVDWYFRHSFVVNREKFMGFLEKPNIRALMKDPAYLARIASKKQLELKGQLARIDQEAEKGFRLYLKGLMEMDAGRAYYSDANSTLRLSYGTVGDYKPRDAVEYDFHTTIDGIFEKEDPDNPEFCVPSRLRQLYEERNYGIYAGEGNLNVCLTTNNDITGGNSGSPLINGKGQLIGIAFDGNWEAMSGDIAFEPELQKTISVDIRYVLFIIDKFAGASNLIEEMTIVK